MIERVILGAILVGAVVAAAVLFRRSYERARTGGGCAGCPLAGDCPGGPQRGDDRAADDERRGQEESP